MARFISNSLKPPSFDERNTTRPPSADSSGQHSRDSSGVSLCAMPPCVDASHIESFHSKTNFVPSALTDGTDPKYTPPKSP